MRRPGGITRHEGIVQGRPLTLKKLQETMPGALLELLCQRHNSAGAFVSGQTLDAPHRKEEVGQTHKRFFMQDRPHPIVKGIEVKATQEEASRVDFNEDSPALLAWAMQDGDDRHARLNALPERLCLSHGLLKTFPNTFKK